MFFVKYTFIAVSYTHLDVYKRQELPKGIDKSKIPAVVTIHDLIFMRYPEFYNIIDRKIYFKKVRNACHAATKIIAISRQTKQDIVTFLQIPPEKIELIYQPVSSVFFEKQNTDETLKKYDLPGCLLYTSRCV